MSFDRSGLAGDEERWLVIIQSSHMLFCDCKNFTNHLKQLLGWRTPATEERGSGPDGGDGEGLEDSDALMAAALDAAETTGEEADDG